MIEKIFFENVSLSFNSREIFKNFTLELSAGKVIGIIGKNGTGKSTFLKLAGKIIKPDSGEVKFSSDLKIAAVTPEMKVYENLTAIENLKFFAKLRGKNLTTENIFGLGQRVGLDFEKFGNVQVQTFSTGMKQRLKFAILLSVDSDIWLLDEPTSGLDELSAKNVMRSIQEINSTSIVIISTHDTHFCTQDTCIIKLE